MADEPTRQLVVSVEYRFELAELYGQFNRASYPNGFDGSFEEYYQGIAEDLIGGKHGAAPDTTNSGSWKLV